MFMQKHQELFVVSERGWWKCWFLAGLRRSMLDAAMTYTNSFPN